MVYKLVRQGKITTHSGKIDPVEADAMLAASRDPAREPFRKDAPQQAAPVQDGGGYHKARTERETYAAKLAQLEYELKVGKVVDAEQVQKSAFECARMVRDACQNLPDRLSPVFAAESNVQVIFALFTKELRACLSSLAGKP